MVWSVLFLSSFLIFFTSFLFSFFFYSFELPELITFKKYFFFPFVRLGLCNLRPSVCLSFSLSLHSCVVAMCDSFNLVYLSPSSFPFSLSFSHNHYEQEATSVHL
ncbi:hypothetical protein STCU_10991 [Strigomonas culicis]|uniref:Uncharacterized protein n=1 Tax=Strigomonas culicis TaxID=28005 RepID=S9TKC4_9TRYP|nr:hypothetical protein STCU_10991 [Strigomonas culicis]|eukprot:EPY16803.1 hypothetical protein STCU_10991 [Strigomonas culicis]